ncbi:MAG: aspartyl protease family protein [Phycisphaerae bacterium]|nr:aspartyl protease family protein [Phycisphaerae bacterium]
MMCVVALLLVATDARAEDASTSRRGYDSSTLASDRLEIPFVQWGGAILVENVEVNGQGPFRFMLDTGAEGAGRVDRTLVEKLDLPLLSDATGKGVLGQNLKLTDHRLDTLSMGELSFTNVVVSSRDYNAERPGGLKPIDGILGFHLFSEYLLTVNYSARTIVVSRGELPPPDGKSIVPIISDDEDPEIEVTIGGMSTKALIDTGAIIPLGLPTALAKNLKFTSEPTRVGRSGGADIESATLDGALRIGDAIIDNPETLIAGPLGEANIGIKIIAQLEVTFDQKNGRIRIERAAAPERYGFVIAKRGTEPWNIKEVAPDSIAESAGLRAGDRVIAVNGQSMEGIDRESLDRLLGSLSLTFEIERQGERMEVRMQKRSSR